MTVLAAVSPNRDHRESEAMEKTYENYCDTLCDDVAAKAPHDICCQIHMRPRRKTRTTLVADQRGNGRDILVDTGFKAARRRRVTASHRSCRSKAAGALRRERRKPSGVVVTHLHRPRRQCRTCFPMRRFHLQDREMSYANGRCMATRAAHPFRVEHVTLMVARLSERVTVTPVTAR